MVLPPLATPAPFAVDLFLVGSNPTRVGNLDWLNPKNAAPDSPIQAALRTRLAPLAQTSRSFVVLDGGDGSVFPRPERWSSVLVASRASETYDSMTESTTVGGRTKTRVLERSTTVTTITGAVDVGDNAQTDHAGGTFLHFGSGEGHPTIVLMDLGAEQGAQRFGTPEDRKHLAYALLFSRDSMDGTERYLARTGLRPTGPVLCRTGVPRARDRDITCFPPEGVVGHYRLVQDGPGWRLRFVEFVRTSS